MVVTLGSEFLSNSSAFYTCDFYFEPRVGSRESTSVMCTLLQCGMTFIRSKVLA